MKRRDFLIGGYVGFTVLFVTREIWKTQREQIDDLSEKADEEYGEGNWHWECGNVCRTVPKENASTSQSQE